jgi:hypothetical protein
VTFPVITYGVQLVTIVPTHTKYTDDISLTAYQMVIAKDEESFQRAAHEVVSMTEERK